MLPKSYLIFKWTVYALATLLLFGLQSLVLNHIHIFGLVPFLYPMLPAVAAMYEGSHRGPVFALALGVVCDLLLPAPFEGFFTVIFTISAILSAVVAEKLISPGFLCALTVSGGSLLLTSGARILIRSLTGGGYLALMARIAVGEALITLPAVLAVWPVYRFIHDHCASDY